MRGKRVMDIGMASKFVMGNNMYAVNWGSTPNAYNRNHKYFRVRKRAVDFKNSLIKKFKKQGYKVEYIYIAD